jgi:RimJ/RimL family protein N-acetyltransferase
MQIPAVIGPVLVGSLLYGADEAVADYVAKHAPSVDERGFGVRDPITGQLPYAAIGVVRNGAIVGGAVFHGFYTFRSVPVDIEMSSAFEPRSGWCTRNVIRGLSEYPFIQLGCRRVTARTARSNKAARRTLEAIGFKLEGIARKAIDGFEDAMLYGLLQAECHWLKGIRANG